MIISLLDQLSKQTDCITSLNNRFSNNAIDNDNNNNDNLNTIDLSRHGQVCLTRLRFERYFSHHRPDDGKSISRNVA